MAHHLDTSKVLTDRRFSELCGVLGVREQCCLDPDRKVIEKVTGLMINHLLTADN